MSILAVCAINAKQTSDSVITIGRSLWQHLVGLSESQNLYIIFDDQFLLMLACKNTTIVQICVNYSA